MRRLAVWSAIPLAALLLTACSASQPKPAKSPAVERERPWVATQKSDEGPVTVRVTWDGPAGGLTFRVAMDTHSVDLDGYDLKRLAALRTERGAAVPPATWDAPPGGHHREGSLVFPDRLPDGTPVLAPGTRAVTLVVREVGGVPERAFTWRW